MKLTAFIVGIAAVAGLGMASGPALAEDPAPRFFAPPHAGDRELPLSEAVRAGPFLFLSGMLGNRPGTTELAPGGIGPETFATLEKIKAVVERHGSSMDRIVKCTVFLADINDWDAMNEVYVTFFPAARPARSAVAVDGLALGARVAIECVALAGEV